MSQFLRTEKIVKKFGDVVAVDHVDLSINTGEIHGLIGENGSGKSTISQMISGIYTITDGKIFIGDKEFKPSSPRDALKEHIAMIVQEVGTIDNLTVAENIFLGDEQLFTKGGILNKKKMNEKACIAIKKIGLDIDVTKPCYKYNFETRKMIEIARALYFDPTLFIVDETTTALSQDGRIMIHNIMKELRDNNKAVLFISHDLQELMETCDTLTILRDGVKVADIDKSEFDENKIKQTMVGRKLEGNYYRNDYDFSHNDEEILKLSHITTKDLKDVSLIVHSGEIVGLGGLSGSGMHEVGRACFGMEKLISGTVTAKGLRQKTIKERFNDSLNKIRRKPLLKIEEKRDYDIKTISDALSAGIGYISKDRDNETLILESSIAENINLSDLDDLKIFGFISPKAERKHAKEEIDNLRIKCSSQRQLVKELSGGNKQKVSFAKWIGNDSKILVFDSPTRGVDIGVKTTMYQLLYSLKKEGYAILIISEELPELIGMSDRICIFKDGKITKEFNRSPKLTDSMIIDYMI